MATTTARSTRLLTALAALALTAGACAGSDGTDPIAERELEEFQSTTTRPLATTTDAPPETAATTSTTEAPPATEAPTTIAVVPVTDAPTTTSGEPADPRDAAIEAALQEWNDSWAACAASAPNCDTAALSSARAGQQLKTSTDIAVARNLNGRTVSNVESYRTQLQSITYVTDAAAEVKACTEDGLIVMDRSGELVDDEFVSTTSIWTFELIDGSWKVTTGRQLRQVSGQENSICAS